MARRYRGQAGGSLPHGGPVRQRSRLAGCLLWLAIFLAILVILAVLFGGFQTGTKVGSPRPSPVAALSQAPAS